MQLSAFLLLPALLRQAIAYTTLSDDSLTALRPVTNADFDINTGKLLAPILVPRVPGTPGSLSVLNHLVRFFTSNLPDWRIEYQNSTSTTPTSNGAEIPFRNLIVTRDPPWLEERAGEVGRLALVAHYDSKLTPHGFIGATDSAAPCAMLLHAAQAIDAALTRKWSAMEAEGVGSGGFDGIEEHKGVQILFLDGEEAFHSWTDTDSLYGARALAEEWEASAYPAASTFRTPIASIDLFVLLDLLGAPNPTVPSYFKTTHWAYQHMADVEARLRALGVLESHPPSPFLFESDKPDSSRWIGGLIGDDHVPFMARGVEVLHIIPSPFPTVWHRIEDDGEHLDPETVRDWAVITAAFAAEWLDLEGHIEVDHAPLKDRRSAKDEL